VPLGSGVSRRLTARLMRDARRDLTKAKRVHMGRPALGDGGASPRVQLRVDRDLDKALRACARKEHRSVSEVARRALREYVDRAA
jgi:Ribbon-helix-helix protein, copG family